MTSTTPINGLRYADLTDPPNAQTLFLGLASDLDTRMIPRFTNTAAMKAAITSPTAGMLAYTTSDDTLWMYNGSKSRWLWARSKAIYASSDQSVTSSTTLVDITGFSVSLEANRAYIFRLNIFYLATAAADYKLCSVFPAGSTFNMGGVHWSTAGTLFYLCNRGSGTTGPTYGFDGATSDRDVTINGYVETSSTAGTFKFQFAQWASSVNSTWTLNGSSFIVNQVG